MSWMPPLAANGYRDVVRGRLTSRSRIIPDSAAAADSASGCAHALRMECARVRARTSRSDCQMRRRDARVHGDCRLRKGTLAVLPVFRFLAIVFGALALTMTSAHVLEMPQKM